MARINRLVLLPCHAIWKGGSSRGAERLEWALVDFQIEGFDHLCFKEHISQGINYIEEDNLSCLVISGGQTKKECGPVSEAESYLQLAKQLMKNDELQPRIILEEYARDSFENVLFLICRFYEIYGYYPEFITVIGFEFKRDRFLKLHFEAMGFPIDRVEYIGNLPDPKMLSKEARVAYFQDLRQSEYKFGYLLFEQDWYGIQAKLHLKRVARDPFKRVHLYSKTNPRFAGFFHNLSTKQDQLHIKCQLQDLALFGTSEASA